MANIPQQVSNAEFFDAGGALYPGGQGRIADIKYCLWDYDGKQAPDSVLAVKLIMQPTDGSNEGKPAEIFWSAGKATEFQPNHDGSKPMALQPSTAPSLRANTNWHFVFTKFRDNCGLQGAQIDGPLGIRALIGSEINLSRIDQPERNIQDDLPPGQAPAKRKFKPTILVPTRCKYPWEGAGAAPVARPAQTNANPAAAPQAAPASSNGHGDMDSTILACLDEILTAEMAVSFTDIPKKVVERLNTRGVTATQRLQYIPKVKDPGYIGTLATASGWAFDGTTLGK